MLQYIWQTSFSLFGVGVHEYRALSCGGKLSRPNSPSRLRPLVLFWDFSLLPVEQPRSATRTLPGLPQLGLQVHAIDMYVCVYIFI